MGRRQTQKWRFPFGLGSEGDVEYLRHPKPWRNEKADPLLEPSPPFFYKPYRTSWPCLNGVRDCGHGPGSLRRAQEPTDLWYSADPVLSSFWCLMSGAEAVRTLSSGILSCVQDPSERKGTTEMYLPCLHLFVSYFPSLHSPLNLSLPSLSPGSWGHQLTSQRVGKGGWLSWGGYLLLLPGTVYVFLPWALDSGDAHPQDRD